MLIRRVKVKPPVEGVAQRIFPPPGDPVSSRPSVVTVVVPGATAIEVLDDPAQKANEGVSIAGKGERTFNLAPGDELYALVGAGEQEAIVIAGST